jgi:hypothetical protein
MLSRIAPAIFAVVFSTGVLSKFSENLIGICRLHLMGFGIRVDCSFLSWDANA